MAEKQGTAACFNDDHMALDRLGRRFRGALMRYFGRRTGDSLDLEDMVQEVFVRLMRRGGTCALERGNINAYIFETASSVLKDRHRKRLSHHLDAHEPFDHERHAAEDFSLEHVMLGRERLERATAALLELPVRTRIIFVLRRLEGLRYDAIAERFGISVSGVEKHMQRAVRHLTLRMDQE